MSYLRSFHRKHERYQAQYDNQHLPDARLARKVLSAVTALSFLGNPFGALAATITDASGNAIQGNNGVYDIYAQNIHGQTGVNQFNKFEVSANDIANMYFKQESGTAWVDNLVNFVNSRIDINGTVNAVKDNKIGGNLFFLSPDGMAVGKTGVINTGSLYVLAPSHGMNPTDTEEFGLRYEGLKGAFTSGTATAETLNSLKTLQIPLNASGTISVLGQINAVGDVKLAAAKIGIGKNVSGTDLADGTKAGDIVSSAKIKTYDSFDFSNVVNIKKEDGTLITSGLGSNLTATKSGNGDIVLAARAENANTWDETFNSLGTYLGLPKVENTNKTIEASVEHYGTVEAAGDVSMTASVTNGNKDRAEELLEETTPAGVNIPDYVPVPAADASNYAQTKAAVTVSGDVTAKGDVKLAAHADNTFVDDGTALTDNVSNVLSMITPMAANVMILDNSAQVTVSKDVDITADGRIDVRADAVLDGTAGAAANGRKLIKKIPDAIPAASVGYAGTTNKATVTIDGNLTAKGKNPADSEGKAVQVAAQAETNVTNAATLNVKGGVLGAGSPGVAAAVAVTNSTNDAAVTVNGTITATKGDADITAKTTNLINTSAAAKVPDGTVGSTAVNVTTHKGSANITVNGDVTAQNVNIDATNYIDENTITANNALGLGKLMANATNSVMTAANVQGITNALKENPLVQRISNKDVQEADKPGLFKTLSEKLAVGAAVVVADETNTANVTFGKNADVKATAGDVKTDANVQVYDSHLFASGTANSYKQDEQGNTDAVTVGAGVVYAGMKNDASVVVADGEGTGDEDKAQITASDDIIMTSKTTMEYHRPERLVREINRSIDNLKYALAAIEGMDESIKEQYKGIIDSLKKLETQLTEYAGTYTDTFMDTVSNPDAVTAEGSLSSIMNAAAGSLAAYNTVTDLQQQFGDLTDVASPFSAVVTNALGVVTGALAFVKPENYANVAAAASAKGGEESTKLSLSGSVTVTDSAQNSGVIIGKNAVLNAGKNLNLQSSNVLEDVNVTGKTMFWTTSASAPGGVGVGGSVNYQGFDTSSKVQVSKGASLTAGDISLGSDSDVFHVGAMMSAGTSDGSAVSGMVAITDSDSVNDVLVDTDAVLTATKQDESKGTIDIAAKNNTNVTNAILSFSASGANVGAGLAAAVNNINVRNTAQIADQDNAEDEEDSKGTGKISAANLNVHAETTGLLNTVSVAGGVTSSGKDDEDPDKEEGLLDKIKAPFTKMEATKDQALDKLNQASDKLQDVLTQMNRNPGNTGTTSTPGETPAETPEAGVPSFTFAGAGSVSLNLVEDTTKTVIDGANIELNNNGKLTAGARDSSFIGAWSGAAGMSFRKGGSTAGGGTGSGASSGNTSVAAAGAVGVNTIDNTIAAIVQNSTITGAKEIDVQAVSGGTAVAAGLGLTVTSDSSSGVGNTNYSGGGSVSVNLIDKNVKANMNDNTVTGAEGGNGADIDVTAYESDVQVTGGVNANIAAGGGSVVGAGVTVADINNTIDAGISGGTYTNIHDAKVQSMMAATQVTAALSVGVAAGGDSGSSNNAFTGAVVYNGLHNNVNARIDNEANITASGTVSAAAKDTRAGSEDAKPYQDLLSDYKNHNSFASDRGIDTTGKSYYDGLDTGDKTVNYDGNNGSIIVGAAAAIAGSDKNAGGAAVNIADIDNNFTAVIDSAIISAGAVKASADADTLLVGASGGVAAGTKNFGAMGSVTWQDLNHDVTAKIANSTITAHEAQADASSHSQSINVAGSVAAGKKAGIGAALAYNGLDNTVRAAMEGNTLKARENGNIDVTVNASNTGSVLGVGVGVAAASKAAVNGSVAVNLGGSNTEAVIDKSDTKDSTVTDAGAVQVKAEDHTERGAVVGSVSASSKAAVGGAVAYNDIGGSSADSNKAAQATTAAIRNTTIRTAQTGEKSVTVQADDASYLDTYAIGAAISAEGAAAQGSAATALINKKTEAVIEKSTITGETDESAAGNVAVNTHNSSNITSSASVATVAGKGAAVGAGVAVNRIVQQTKAAVEGGKLNVGNLTVHADGTPSIKNIGIGVAVAGQGAGATGSVAVNKIANNVTAHIGSGANVTADGSVGVIATSDEQLANYAGQVAVAGQGASVGLSVSVNEISGTTSATVGGEDEAETTVTAKGNDSLTTNTDIPDGQINNALIGNDSVDINLHINRENEERKGLIVDASSTRDLKSFLVTAAVTGEGAAVPATVNVNKIAGATNAGIANANINEDLAGSDKHNVTVDAGDYTNSSGFVGSAGVGGIGAGVGLGSDTNLVSRSVSASVEDSDVTANAFDVKADSKQGVSSFTIGAGVAGIGGGVAGVVNVTDMNNTTKASVQGGTITAKTANITADHEGIVNAGNVGVGVGGVGAGAGLSVGVLKDNSTTEVVVGDRTNEDHKTTITADEDLNVSAVNTTTVNPTVSATGIGAGGIAGATSVNNLNSTVKTSLANAALTSTSGSIEGQAKNTLNVKAYMGAQAAGGIGVGAGVTVNTIDSTVKLDVTDSTLTAAKDVSLTADETRNVKQTATNVAVGASGAAGVNIAVTTVGKAVEDEETNKKIDEANSVFGDTDLLAGAGDALGTADIGKDTVTPTVDAGLGGDKDSQITVNVTNSSVTADKKVTAQATEKDDITMTLGGAAASASTAVNAGVGILDVNRNVGVHLRDATITAPTIDVGTDITGTASLNVYQGTAGLYGANAAFGKVTTGGHADVSITGSQLLGKELVRIQSLDSAKTNVDAWAVTASAVAVGALVAQAANDSSTGISIDGGSTIVAASSDKDEDAEKATGKVEITANRQNEVTAQAHQVTGGLIGGSGLNAAVSDQGASTVTVGNNNTLKAAETLTLLAKNAPTASANVLGISGSVLYGGAVNTASVTIGAADKALQTKVTLGSGNTLAADDVQLKADGAIAQNLDMYAVSISGKGNVNANVAGVQTYSDAQVTAEDNNIYTGFGADEDGDLTVDVNNAVQQNVDAHGIGVAGLFATGTNIGKTAANLTTKADLQGSAADSRLNDVNVKASSFAKMNNTVNGDGGAAADISTWAAKAENNYTAHTDVTLRGSWKTSGALTVQALNGMDVDILSSAARASVIGGSGTWLNNVIHNTANVNVTDAEITTDGAQKYNAQNTVDYTGTIEGSGYGGASVNASDYEDDLLFAANVNVTNSTLTGAGDGGSITASANTQGTIHSKNGLKSAGVIPMALAFSKHAIDYNHGVNIAHSTLTTDKKDQNITLSASDSTDVTLETIADTQGGVVGAASAQATNVLKRANTINVDDSSTLYSTNDINLYAGTDTNGLESLLNLQVLADAYNKTALPLVTRPEVSNTMTQANQVLLAGTAESVRNINGRAEKGTTTVTESAKEYNIYDGTSGTGTVASTALGDTVHNQTTDNKINVTGTARAGIHNELDITISGSTTNKEVANENGQTSEGQVSYEDITITVNKGSDWFDADSIKPESFKLVNGMLERYNEVRDLMQQYGGNTDSKEYKAYQTEMASLLQEMQKVGLVAKDKDGNWTQTPLESADLPAISIPDIVISGGNINLYTDTVTGAGEMEAKGSPQLTITNKSDLYLQVNDLTIKDAGGQIRLNDAAISKEAAGNQFTGNANANAGAGDTPTITIHGASPSAFENGTKNPQADIAVVGNITNSAGNINIKNDNYNIQVQGDLSARNILLSAEKGSVTQTSSDGVVNVGGDPVTKYQFSEAVAKKIQEYLYSKKQSGTKSFATYDEYVQWLKEEVKLTDAELGSITTDEKEGSIQAGNSVYINAVNVNIGGLVQSGYNKYETTLTEADKAAVTRLDEEWKKNQKVLSDDDVLGNDKYVINGGGKVWNKTDKLWDYEVKVYYNPSTKQLLTDTVSPDGGKVYITGKISSTGNGRIRALDGTADIAINTTAVDRDVKVNRIVNNDIDGLISITDKNKNQVTEYKKDSWRQYELGTKDTLPEWQTGSGSYMYTPKEGTQYTWTGGYTGSVITKYQYSEKFLFWGGLDYGKSDQFVADLNQAGKTPTATPISSGKGDNLANGALITQGQSANNALTIHWNYSADDTNEKYSDVVANKQYDGVAGKIFGYGNVTYTWTGTKGDVMSSSTDLKADYGIDIGFIGGVDKKGDISVTTNKDLLINGSIANATVLDQNNQWVGKGSINLTSQNGAVSSLGGAAVQSDSVNIKAQTGIDVHHSAIGSAANVQAVTDKGNISFVSDNGDLNIQKMYAGGTDTIQAGTGNVYVEGHGSLLNGTDSGYAVKGQRIDLVSRTGSIGTKDEALTILGGSTLYSSDTMASSVNAKAQGDIVLTQVDGNMRLGTIESTEGDAVLTANKGSFVDAHPSDNTDNSTAQEKLDRWLENGLINKDDDADSSNAAAEAAKKERLEGLESQFKILADGNTEKVQLYKDAAAAFNQDMADAKAAYLQAAKDAGGNTEKLDAAYAAYKQAYTEYLTNKGFADTAEQDAIANYADLSSSTDYGWSRNQLLYAIQNSVLNSKPGEVTTVKTPNVKAQNITLHAEQGGIGIDGEAKVISYDALNQEDNLKLLASAKAGDLTWNEDDQTVTIRRQQAITAQVTGDAGKVDVVGKDNVYLAGVAGTALNINGIDTSGDIRLQGDAGVQVQGSGVLKGQDLTIAGGTGNIGSAEQAIKTAISGALELNTKESAWIQQQSGNLNIQAVSVGKNADIGAAGSILAYDVPGSTAQGYINVGDTLTLKAGEAIGTADQGIRILDTGAVVNATADNGGIYLSGVSGEGSKDSLILGTIKGQLLDVQSVSSLSLGREAEDDKEAVQGSIETTGDASLTGTDIQFASGSSAVIGSSDQGTFSLTATNGSITQSKDAAGIAANTVHLSSTGSQTLTSSGNTFQNVTVNGLEETNSLTGDVNLVSMADSLTANLNGITVKDGSISVQNTKDNGALHTTGDAATQKSDGYTDKAGIILTSEGSVTNDGALTSADSVTIQAQTGITANNAITAGTTAKLTTESGGINVKGAVDTKQGATVEATESGDISLSGNVQASDSGNVTVTTKDGNVTISGSAISKTGDVAVQSDKGSVTIGTQDKGGLVQAGANAMLKATDGNVQVFGNASGTQSIQAIATNGGITINGTAQSAQGAVSLNADGGDVNVNGSVTGGTSVTANATNGSISIKGEAEAQNGSVSLTASDEGSNDEEKGNITVEGNLNATESVTAETTNGDISITGDIASGTNTNLTANQTGTITIGTEGSQNGKITAGTTAELTTTAGDIHVNGAVDTQTGATVEATNSGSITITGDVRANKSGNVAVTTEDGNVTISGNAISKVGDVTVQSDKGSVTIGADGADGLVHAGTDAILKATGGNVHVFGNVSGTQSVRAVSANGGITINGTAQSEQGEVSLDASGGDVHVSGSVTGGTSVTANATNGSISINGAAEAQNGAISLTASDNQNDEEKGNITVEGNLNATESVTVETTNGDISITGAITSGTSTALTANQTGTITIGKDGTSGKITAGTTAALTTESGGINVNGAVDTKQGATVKASNSGSITITGDVRANDSGNVTVTTKDGDVTISGSAISKADNVLVQSEQGGVSVAGSLEAGKDVTASANGSIFINGEAKANDGSVSLTALDDQNDEDKGNITVDGTLTASQAVTVTTDNGVITIGTEGSQNGKITAGTTAELTTAVGDIHVNGAVDTQTGATVQASNSGSITITGDVQASDSGDVALTTNQGGISVTGSLNAAKGAVTAETTNGAIAIQGTVDSGTNTSLTTKTEGDISFGGTVKAGTDISAETTNGNIVFNGAVNAEQNIVAHAVNNGGITIRQDVTAGQGLTLQTNNGDILFDNPNNKSEEITAKAENGDVSVSITGKGNLTDTRHDPNGDKGNLRATQGNVTITHNGHGDIDLYEVYAKKDNKITVTDGDLHLVNASGSLVALLVKNAEKDLDVKNVEAAAKIEISGSDIDLDNITQREDGNGYLIITPQGSSEDKPIDNLVMGNITTNTGVRFDKLWLNTGEINVTGGALLLDKVYVQDKAVFTNGAMKTHVFGRAPEWDASADSSYWIDTDKNRPQDNLDAWKNGSGDWMYLYFLPQDRIQYSNGNLLHLAEHHDVFSQRYAQTSWMQHVTSPSFHDFYTKYYTPDLTYHDRYLLIDHEEADVINAPSEHIVVE